METSVRIRDGLLRVDKIIIRRQSNLFLNLLSLLFNFAESNDEDFPYGEIGKHACVEQVKVTSCRFESYYGIKKFKR